MKFLTILLGLPFLLTPSLDGCRSESRVASNERIGVQSTSADTLRLLFVGDIMCHATQLNAAKLPDGTFDFTAPYDSVRTYFEQVDVVIGNLETTLGPPPYSGYPHFRSPEIMAAQLAEVGFDILSTANNHVADTGLEGIYATIKSLRDAGIRSMGSYVNSEDRKLRVPLLLDTLGVKVAFLAYTYDTNGITVPKPAEVSVIDTLVMVQELAKAKFLEPDITIVFMHWGEEYQLQHSAKQEELATWLHTKGVDAIIGSHPHVVQPLIVEELEDGVLFPVAYSLGNFLTNQHFENTQDGMMLELLIVKEGDSAKIIEVYRINTYCNRNVARQNHYRVEMLERRRVLPMSNKL